MNIISLPTELSNLEVNIGNIEHFLYSLNYFYAPDCIEKKPSANKALDFIKRFGGIGDENDSIYEKFIPISKANLVREKTELGFSFNIMDYDYPDCFVASEIVYYKWHQILRFEQKLEYKINSLINLHGVEVERIASLADDCESLDFSVRAEHQLSLMNQLWDSNYYAIYDDNIVWGAGYSEVGAFFSSLENHTWLEGFIKSNIDSYDPEAIMPYPNSTEIFTKMINLIMSKDKNWKLGNNLMMFPCTKRVFKIINTQGLSEFDFYEKNGYLDIVE